MRSFLQFLGRDSCQPLPIRFTRAKELSIKPRIIKALAGDNAVAILQMIGCVIGIGHDQDIIGPLVISKGIKPDNNAPFPLYLFLHLPFPTDAFP